MYDNRKLKKNSFNYTQKMVYYATLSLKSHWFIFLLAAVVFRNRTLNTFTEKSVKPSSWNPQPSTLVFTLRLPSGALHVMENITIIPWKLPSVTTSKFWINCQCQNIIRRRGERFNRLCLCLCLLFHYCSLSSGQIILLLTVSQSVLALNP
jgi:hypothetical protein